jgi:hypothetical protein
VRARWREPAPGEREAGERSWEVVLAAFAAREPVPRKRAWWPIAAAAAGAAVVAAALSPPGLAVLDSIRDAVRGEPNAKPALFSLPTDGRLLVNSSRGAWVVQPDGSKRLLEGYRDASWSPRGLYLAAARGNELVALEPGGDIHWSLARRGRIAAPRWSDETPPCCRIAYIAGRTIRVVNGDGTGDKVWQVRVAPVAPAWRPGTHVLAGSGANHSVEIGNAESVAPDRSVEVSGPPRQLAWTADGRRLVVVEGPRIRIYTPRGRLMRVLRFERATAATSPDSQRLAVVRPVGANRSEVRIANLTDGTSRVLFSGAGDFGGAVWSPDGRWLLVPWPAADQWLFLPANGRGRVRAVANITASFGGDASIAGWCCG